MCFYLIWGIKLSHKNCYNLETIILKKIYALKQPTDINDIDIEHKVV